MSLLSLFFLFLLVGPALARQRHVITLPTTTSDLHPSSLAWDPSAQHFLIGSSHRPVISSVSDAGVLETLTTSDDDQPSSFVSAVSVDDSRRRLIAAFSSPARIAAYDLRSPRPHRLLFSSPLPDPSSPVGGASFNPTTGTAFVAAGGRIYTADTDGGISVLAHVSEGLAGLAHFSMGFLLAVEKGTGAVLKVDAEDGKVHRVIIPAAAEAAESLAVRTDGAAVVAGGAAARWVDSKVGWAEVAVHDEFRVGEGERIHGVVVREGRRAYVLVSEGGSLGMDGGEGYNGKTWRIEEVEWGREGEGEMVWGLVLVGLGLAYFLYWRFQMGKLVASVNKKRA